jgi:CDP-diacylglycerol--glycerol-3-phosphate 3-phosphatidyltransferase
MSSILKFVPNFLSILRIILLIPLVIFIKNGDIVQITVFCLLILASDYLDGFLARKWQATSITGRVLDPLADKISISAVAVAAVVFKGFPLLLLVAFMLRDLIILIASIVFIRKLKEVPASNFTGKIAVGVMSVCMLVFLFSIEPLKLPLVIAAAIMIPISLWSYGMRLYRLLRAREK